MALRSVIYMLSGSNRERIPRVKKSLLENLIDPNDGSRDLRLYAIDVVMAKTGTVDHNIHHENLELMDDVERGFVRSIHSGRLYPIVDFILSLLSDEDVRPSDYISFFDEILTELPVELQSLVRGELGILKRLIEREKKSKWNWEEMDYYDADVNTKGKRDRFLKRIRNEPLPHIFLEREKYLLCRLKKTALVDKTLLEVGCGNSRTISWLLPPTIYRYNYIGVDISFDRLRLAKKVIPEGDFIQSNGLNLPFLNDSLSFVVFFGSLHHMPDPLQGIREGLSKIESQGLLLLHEPIEKVKNILPLFRNKSILRLVNSYEHSEHDNELDWDEASVFLDEQAVAKLDINFSTTILRTIAARLLHQLPVLSNNDYVWRGLIYVDKLFRILFCRNRNCLGPNAVFAAIRRT